MEVHRLQGRWAPMAEAERARTLDVLRGFAIFGVLAANTLTFAYPMASSPPELAAWRGTGIPDVLAVFAVGLLVEGKFYTLLSILFGLGLVIQAARAASTGRRFVPFYLRRSGLLLAIGLLHAVLLYAADILMFYAVIAVAVLPFRGLSRRNLAVAAFVCAGVGIAVLAAYAWSHPARPYPKPPDWYRLGEQAEPAPDFIVANAANILERVGISRQQFYGMMADEARISRDGTWLELIGLRSATALFYALPFKLLLLGPMFMSFFLFGMYIGRGTEPKGDTLRTLFMRPDPADAPGYRRLCFAGLPAGLLLTVIAGGFQAVLPRAAITPVIYWSGTFGGVLLQSLGYASGIILLWLRRPGGRIVRGLADVGRMALTNYIGQSLVLGFVFYGTGLGLFGRMTALPVVALAVPVFGLQVLFSQAWLRRFSAGPVEWAWRCLAYGSRLPLRR